MKRPTILECTLRDASYSISFQFTAEDTAVIAAGLEDAGFTAIEVGHGLGLAASRKSRGIAAATDQEYIEAAAGVLSTALVGVFCIPGIAELEHLDLAARSGAGFVRIGTDVTETHLAEPFLKRAKELGLTTSANLMKTYALPPDEVLRRAVELADWGADIVAVVDSAGGMLPREVAAYVKALSGGIPAEIGFHGHDNLHLAVANSLAAIEAGATWVDSTLRGMGRSTGNAQTEVLAMLLTRLGFDTGLDLFKVMDLAENVISPMAGGQGVDPIALVSGYAQFHSSFLRTVERAAAEFGVDPRHVIIGVSELDRVQVSDELAREVASRVQAPQRPVQSTRGSVSIPVGIPSGETPAESARRIAEELRNLALKSHRASVFTISWAPIAGSAGPRFPFIRGNTDYVIANAEVRTQDEADAIASVIDGLVDYVLVDAGPSPTGTRSLTSVSGRLTASQPLTYLDRQAHVNAVDALLAQLFETSLEGKRVLLCGLSEFALRLALHCLDRGLTIRLADADPARVQSAFDRLASWAPPDQIRRHSPTETVDIVLGTALREVSVHAEHVERLREGGILIDAGVGSLSPGALQRATERGLAAYRIDMRAGLFGHTAVSVGTAELVSRVMGGAEVAGARVVAGGVVGARGAVVVDAIDHPTRIIGVADGAGHLLGPEEARAFRAVVDRVRQAIIQRRLPG